MLFPKDAVNLIQVVNLINDASGAILAVPFGDVSLQVSYKLQTSGAWVSPTLVDGTLGTYLANSWKEIGGGLYQWCPPNAVIVSGTATVVRMTYGANKPRYDVIEARLTSLTSVLTITANDIDAIVDGVTAVGPGLSNAIQADKLTIRIADEWEQTITGLGDITDRTDVVFCLKENVEDTDLNAKIYVTATAGLTRVNGVAAADASKGSITIVDAAVGTIRVRLHSAVTAKLTAADRRDAVKILVAAGNDRTQRAGTTIVQHEVVRQMA